MIDRWTDELQARLDQARIGIAGAGGLGSNCAMALARAGVGQLVLLDHDQVELSNLNRQAFTMDQVGLSKVRCLQQNILAAAPGCQLTIWERWYHSGMAGELFTGCQVVVEAFDTPEAKTALLEDVLARLPNTWLVAGSGIAGVGGNESLRTRRYGRLYVVGDGVTAAAEDVPLLGPRVIAAAALQANQALALALGDEEI